MIVVPVPCLSDNYAYLLVAAGTNECLIVDPSEGEPVIAAVKAYATRDNRGLTVKGVLCTHHHHDHVGGVEAVCAQFGLKDVYGYESDKGRIPMQSHFLKDGEKFSFADMTITAMHIPGHTLGAVAYLVTDGSRDPLVFTGDTLFVGGCGRVFEGDPPMMHASLEKLAKLSGETRVFCGHEYTEANYRFAHTIEPSNMRLEKARERATALRSEKKPTVPSTIEEERATNPFLRIDSAEIKKAVGADASTAPAEIFGKVRAAKDVFRPSGPISK